MARKTKDVVIDAAGRDAGKTYRLTEMPAMLAEKWAARLLLGMARSGLEVPEDLRQAGMAAIAPVLLRGLGAVEWPLAEKLLDEMLMCVTVVVQAAPMGRQIIDGDIEEVGTLLRLRREWVELHTGFSLVAALQALAASAATEVPAGSPPASTSPT